MSACISRHGEYSSHKPDGKWVCKLCGDIDHYALVAEVERLRADVHALTGEHERAELWRAKANRVRAVLDTVPVDDRLGTHHDECHHRHPYCLAQKVRDALEDK